MSSGEVEQELARIRGEIDALAGVEDARARSIESALGKFALFNLENEHLRLEQSSLLQDMQAAAMWNATVENSVTEVGNALDHVLLGSPAQEAMTMHGMWEEFKRARENAYTFSNQVFKLTEQVLREAHSIRVDDPPVAQAHLDAYTEEINQLLRAALEAATEAVNYAQGSGNANDQYRPRL